MVIVLLKENIMIYESLQISSIERNAIYIALKICYIHISKYDHLEILTRLNKREKLQTGLIKYWCIKPK